MSVDGAVEGQDQNGETETVNRCLCRVVMHDRKTISVRNPFQDPQ